MDHEIIMPSERRHLSKKEYILNDSIYRNSKKCKLIYSYRKKISNYLVMGGEREGQKGETAKGNECAHMRKNDHTVLLEVNQLYLYEAIF